MLINKNNESKCTQRLITFYNLFILCQPFFLYKIRFIHLLFYCYYYNIDTEMRRNQTHYTRIFVDNDKI